MKDSIKFTNLNHDIINAMSSGQNEPYASKMIDFFKSVNQKYTFSQSEEKYFINSFFPSFPSMAWDRLINWYKDVTQNNQHALRQADIVVTGKCHCNCWHCFRSKHNSQDLELKTIKSCIDQLNKMGVSMIGITGGEPMMREDIVDIIKLIPDGMEGQLYTTGYLIDDKFAQILKNSNVTRCLISLDHYDKKIANSMRNYDNAFEDAINAIEVLSRHNIYTTITVCVTENLLKREELTNYFEFAKQLSVDEIRVIMPIPQGKLEGKNFSRLYSDAIRYIKQFKKDNSSDVNSPSILNFCEFESSSYIGCSAGSSYISINNDGNVTPCVALPLTLGNVNNDSIQDIFNKMEKYFPHAGRVCYGKISGRVLRTQNIDTSVTPLPINTSIQVVENCKISNEKPLFFKNTCI